MSIVKLFCFHLAHTFEACEVHTVWCRSASVIIPSPRVLALIKNNRGHGEHISEVTLFSRAKGVNRMFADIRPSVLFDKMAALWPRQSQLHINEFWNWQQRPTYVFSVMSLMEKAAVTGVKNLKWVTIFSEWAEVDPSQKKKLVNLKNSPNYLSQPVKLNQTAMNLWYERRQVTCSQLHLHKRTDAHKCWKIFLFTGSFKRLS